MNPILAETIYADFITSSPTTGAAVDADTLPTAEVFEDATDTAIVSPTVTKRTGKTGNYRVPVACTTANGFEIGKSYNVAVSATVGGVAAKAIIQTFQVRDVAAGGGGDASQTTLLAVKAKTDALPTDPADASDIAASFTTVNTKLDTITTGLPLDTTELNAIADALLKRDWNSVTGEAAYSALNAFRMLRNVWNTTGGTLSVKKEDGSTNAWTRTLTVDPTAQPITGAS